MCSRYWSQIFVNGRRCPSQGWKTVRGTPLRGDYSFLDGEDVFSVERRTLQNLVGCCTDESSARFFREMHRLRGYRLKRLLVVGKPDQIETHTYVGQVTPHAVFATVAALEARFDVPVVWEPTPEAAARKIELWAYWASRDLVVAANDLARARELTRRREPAVPLTHPSNFQ